MRTLPAGLATHLLEQTTKICRLWLITRLDGEVFAFTDHDVDVTGTIDGDVYQFKSGMGFTVSSIFIATGMGTQGLTFKTACNANYIDEGDVRAGRYDGATFEVFFTNWSNPSAGIASLFFGEFTDIDIGSSGELKIEVRGGSSGDKIIMLGKYSASCRHDFGDDGCKYPIENERVEFTVSNATVGDRHNFTSGDLLDTDNYWRWGIMRFLTGANEGLVFEVAASSIGGSVTLFLPTPYDIAIGDTGEIYPGCDKQWGGGCLFWENRLNFGGEPFATVTGTT